MNYRKTPYTDKELCDDAKRFETRRAWKAAGALTRATGAYSHYGTALKRGRDFMKLCCAHMKDERGGKRYQKYTDDDLKLAARKFQTRGAWRNEDYNRYQIAQLRPIFEECCAHMRPAANPFAADYVVYAYEFSDKHCYVGLTFVPENRKIAHALRGPVFEHSKVCPDPFYRSLMTGATCIEAIAAESTWQARYTEEGWIPLYSAKAGSLGSIKTKGRWTKSAVLAEALRYQTKQAWIDGSQMSYRIAKREGWFAEAAAHMPKRVLGIGAGVAKTPEAKDKMRQAKLGTTLTAVHKSKIAAGVTLAWGKQVVTS